MKRRLEAGDNYSPLVDPNTIARPRAKHLSSTSALKFGRLRPIYPL